MIEAADKRVILIALAAAEAPAERDVDGAIRAVTSESAFCLYMYLHISPTNDQHLFYSEQTYIRILCCTLL